MTEENHPMTLGELVKALQETLDEHPEAADKAVLIPMDEEGNEFHELMPSITVEPVYISMCLEDVCHPDWARYDNCVILG